MKGLLAALVAAAALATPAYAGAPPLAMVADDGGSAGTTCRWNPYWRIQCNVSFCYWVGRFEWYDPAGNPTGTACA